MQWITVWDESRNVENQNISGTKDDDILSGTSDGDTIAGNSGDDIIYGGMGHDFLLGNKGNDWIEGGGNADTIQGGKGDDWIFGGNGLDELHGDFGNDILIGGRSADVFVFEAKLADTYDIVADWTADDTILLEGFEEGSATVAHDGLNATIEVDGADIAVIFLGDLLGFSVSDIDYA